MDERERFRASFEAESADRIARLEQGLLALESDPRDAQLLDRMFRDAHNLKGGARMLGLEDLQEAAHRFEDVLGAARSGEAVLTADDVQRLFEDLDRIRSLVRDDARRPDAEAPPRAPTPSPAPPAPSPVEEAAPERQWAAHPPSLPSDARMLESIRIEPDRLDALMRRAVELNTARLRLAGRPRALEASEARANAALRLATSADAPEDVRRDLRLIADELGRLRRDVGEDATRLDSAARGLEDGIRDVRLVPVDAIFDLVPRLVRDLTRDQGKAVRLETEGGHARADKAVLDALRDPLMHIVRNAIDHGMETPSERTRAGKPPVGRIRIRAWQTPAGLRLAVSDDGRGIDEGAVREAAVRAGLVTQAELDEMSASEVRQLIFVPGFTTRASATDVSGRGVGLDVVREKIDRLKGRVELESSPGEGATFRLSVPVTLLTALVLVVEVEGRPYGLPIERVEHTRRVAAEDFASLKGAPVVETPRGPVPVVHLEDVLQLPTQPGRPAAAIARERKPRPCVVLIVDDERLGILVDGLRGEEEALVRPLGPPIERLRNVAGTTLLGTGEVCTVLDAADLVRSVTEGRHLRARVSAGAGRRTVLLVEDSIMTRTYEQRILEEAGFNVVTAVDGVDAWGKLESAEFDAVVTDVDMPRMDGYALTERIRSVERLVNVPVVIVTAHETDEHRRRGMAAGADAYVEKPSFNQTRLIDSLRELIG